METSILKLTVDYLIAHDSLTGETQSDDSERETVAHQKDKEYEAIQWAEFVLQNLDEIETQVSSTRDYVSDRGVCQ